MELWTSSLASEWPKVLSRLVQGRERSHLLTEFDGGGRCRGCGVHDLTDTHGASWFTYTEDTAGQKNWKVLKKLSSTYVQSLTESTRDSLE